MKRFARLAFVGVISLISISQVFCPVSRAGLGDKESLSDADRTASNVSAVRTHSAFSIKEIVSNSVQVREYLNRDGVVFGMAWKGRNHPDFSSLLGSYYTEYEELNARRETGPRMRGGRRSLQGAHLVIEKFGHMGALKGRAFIPSLIPAGVNTNEIK